MRKPAPVIRTTTNNDLPALLALYRHLHPDEPAPDPAMAERAFAALQSSGLTTIFVAELEGQLVSSCTLAIIPNLTRNARPYAMIENVVTHANHRQQGLARAVLHAARDKAWEAKCYKLLLATGSKQQSTLSFYESAGFRRGGKTYFEMRPD